MPAEALFYHLTIRPLEDALPELLEKCLARGWRAVLRATSPERVAALGARLWTYREDAFLPHGDAGDGRPERQPIYLTDGSETPNAPDALFLVDGAEATDAELRALGRIVTLFDGRDPSAVETARAAWRRAAAIGCPCVYWAQDERGGWVRRAGG